MNKFVLHPTLAADCHDLGIWRDMHILLHRDAHVRWLILVPESPATEWHELPGPMRNHLAAVSSALSAMLKIDFACDKVNIAAIGNMVPQFHFHVVGRFRTDPYWPGVVWGRVEPGCVYGENDVENLRARVLDSLAGLGEA